MSNRTERDFHFVSDAEGIDYAIQYAKEHGIAIGNFVSWKGEKYSYKLLSINNGVALVELPIGVCGNPLKIQKSVDFSNLFDICVFWRKVGFF